MASATLTFIFQIIAIIDSYFNPEGTRVFEASDIAAWQARARAATRAKRTALQARYLRIKRHRGHKKAVVAVGHQILEIAYYVMRDGTTYQELGADYFERRHRERAAHRHLRQLERLGYQVLLVESVA